MSKRINFYQSTFEFLDSVKKVVVDHRTDNTHPFPVSVCKSCGGKIYGQANVIDGDNYHMDVSVCSVIWTINRVG